MSVEHRKILRILIVGAAVGGIAAFLNYCIEKNVKSVTKA